MIRKHVFGHSNSDFVCTKHRRSLNLIKLYFKRTSLHGFPYITADDTHAFHRAVWTVVCTIGVAGAALMTYSVYNMYIGSPTMTVVDDINLPVYNYPFPAVTVCSVNKVQKSKAEELFFRLTKSSNASAIELYMVAMQAMNYLLYPKYYQPMYYLETHNYSFQDLPRLEQYFNITKLMLQVQPTCEEIFAYCFWRGSRQNCCEIFLQLPTEDGFCYSFNSRIAHAQSGREDFEPWRNYGHGTLSGLEVLLKHNLSNEYLTQDNRLKGITVYIHHPNSYPSVTNGAYVPFNNTIETNIIVSPVATYSTPEVKKIGLSKRKCLFSDEGNLTLIPDYQQRTCQMECRMLHLAQHCHCTPYLYPRNDVRECGIEDMPCLSKHDTILRFTKPTENHEGSNETTSLTCTCYRSCSDTSYDAKYTAEDTSNAAAQYGNGYFQVYYGRLTGVMYRTDVVFGWSDLIVAIGGIFALCLGSSLVSVLELIFWFLLQPLTGVICWNKRESHHLEGAKKPEPRPRLELDAGRIYPFYRKDFAFYH